jgi:hypothetical protein
VQPHSQRNERALTDYLSNAQHEVFCTGLPRPRALAVMRCAWYAHTRAAARQRREAQDFFVNFLPVKTPLPSYVRATSATAEAHVVQPNAQRDGCLAKAQHLILHSPQARSQLRGKRVVHTSAAGVSAAATATLFRIRMGASADVAW